MKKIFLYLILILLLTSCYSFRGGSIPDHLNTIQIRNVIDNSNYGDPTYKEYLYQKMSEVIRKDNSLKIETQVADSRINLIISSVREEVLSTSASSGLEKERKIVVSVSFEFYDNIKKQVLAKNQNLTISQSFEINNVPTSRVEAVKKCLDIISEEVLNNMISGS